MALNCFIFKLESYFVLLLLSNWAMQTPSIDYQIHTAHLGLQTKRKEKPSKRKKGKWPNAKAKQSKK